jgi:hypothetical protein
MAGLTDLISKYGNPISAGFSAGMGLTKGIIGAVQLSRVNKALKGMKAPTYTRPDEVNELVDLYRQRAAATQLPGQEAIESGLGATVAQGVSDVQRSASSSVSALGAITDLYGKKQSAIRDLGIQFAEFKAARQGELAGALGKSADYSDTEWEMNKLRPYEVKMNELTSQKQAGAANLFGGGQEIGMAFNNLMGTQNYTDILKRLQGEGQGSGGSGFNPFQSKAAVDSAVGSIKDFKFGGF